MLISEQQNQEGKDDSERRRAMVRRKLQEKREIVKSKMNKNTELVLKYVQMEEMPVESSGIEKFNENVCCLCKDEKSE
jgi:hypothetical protein